MPEPAARRRLREAREQATAERLAAEAGPEPRPLGAKREQQIRDLPTQINHNAWSAAYDAGNAIRDLVAELDRLRAERPEGTGPDLSGWTPEENAEFEELYGVQAAMRLRASNNRVWQIVHELRLKAADAGLDPYQDPMAQRLSAALVQPEPEEPSDA